jgi:hypothetical protein
MYDELHSYRVASPDGWCCGPDLRCSRRDTAGVLEVRHSYLDLDEKLQSAVASDLRKTDGKATRSTPIETSQGRKAETWRIQRTDGGVELVAYFLEEEVCLVRLSFSNDQAVSTEAEGIFKSFVKSYESSPQLPNKSLERTRGR